MGLGDQAMAGAAKEIPSALKNALTDSFKQAQTQSRGLFKTQQPIRRELSAQILEALKTGGVGAQIPIVQRAVEGTKQATSGALRGTEEALAGGNLMNTPFGQQILAQQRQAGAQAASNIPTDIARAFIGGAPEFIGTAGGQAAGLSGGLASSALGAYGGAAQQRMQSKATTKGGKGQGLGAVAGGMLGPAGAAAPAVAACDIRFKTNVMRVDTSPNGFGVYEFNYISEPTKRYRGPVAQNVRSVQPNAVVEDHTGVLYVILPMIDVPLEVVHG